MPGSTRDITSNSDTPVVGFDPARDFLFGVRDLGPVRFAAPGGLGGPARIVDVTASRQLSADDDGAVLVCDAATDILLTLPGLSTRGISALAVRAGTGAVRFTASVGHEMHAEFAGHDQIAARWGIATVLLLAAPAGGPAVWLLSGSTA
ncbi:hypothetical protein V5F77_28155 [Xanthobacter sp. DSM 24535]|uniref:hypothetical protein n=1 Tax=Roseixanthobacter psychrophilus TaxID=3119917 RepID=UPI00372638AE